MNNDIKIRNKKYEEFRKEFTYSRNCLDYESLTELAKERYTDVIVGSDQLWLPVNIVSDYYTLNWVPEEINKISYSTSFGFSSLNKKYNNMYKNFLNRINHISVREESGQKIIDNFKLRSELVADPTLLLTKDEWDKITIKARIIEEKYILCYFLGKNKEHRKFAERLKEKTGLKIVSLNHADEYVRYSDKYCDYAPYDIGPKEFINLIKNAEYVLTDSFHGTIFSIIFNKKFYIFKRYKESKYSTNSRIDSLIDTFKIPKEIILSGTESIEKVLSYKIDYELTNKIVKEIRKKSIDWLLKSITWKEKKLKCIEIDVKEDCCGCTACMNVCPKSAIEMEMDEEGFLYPKVHKSKCINCGLCKNVCPILNKNKNENFNQKGYIFQYKEDDIRLESTSGGFFTAIAEYILKNKGVVYGVSLDKNFVAKHERVTDKQDLWKFRNSKYVQSDPNKTFKQVKQDLGKKLLVCYSGTACEIEGLKFYLNKAYDNLITVDVICRGVPSPLLWKKYIEEKNKNGQIDKVYFREKKYGYKYSNLCLHNKANKIIYSNGIESDQYLRAFFSNIACRPSCYNCHFKEQYHKADFTIWDCFNVYEYDKNFDDDKGTTRVLINSKKGNQIFNQISKEHNVKKIEIEKLVNNFYQMFNPIKYNRKRKIFFKELNVEKIEKVLNKYFPNSFKNKFEKYMRIMLIKMHIYKSVIKLGKKIRRRH